MTEKRSSEPIRKRPLTNPKQVQMAAKVKLMKMKGKATGDSSIPQSERIFLYIALPADSKKPALPMFFSKVGHHQAQLIHYNFFFRILNMIFTYSVYFNLLCHGH